MCLWCQLKFESKMDLLQHFVSLHQDMLVSDEGNSELVVEATSLLSQAGADSASLDSDRGSCVLDLSSKAKCKLEKNKDGRYTQVVDLTNQEIPESIDEALDLTKSKVNDEPKDGNSNIVVKAINIPPQDNRPKYSLNSLIEALRNTIEQDRRDGKIEHTTLEEDCAPQSDVEGSSDEENELAQSSDLKYPEPSSDSESSRDAQNQANNDTEVQVSVKTFQVDGKTMYRCSKCNKVFSKTCTFARHAMVHAKLYPYQCGVCDAKFRDMRIMLRHLDWHGENVDCPCKKCEKINDEERKKSEDKGTKFRFQCDICLKKFISDEVCIAHINMHKKKSKLQCDICKMEFYCNKKLSRHRKISHSIQYCPVCLEACSDLSIHIQKHQGSVLFRCGLCADGFNSRPQLHEHLKVHTFLGKGSERSEGDSKQGQKKQKAASLDNSKSSAYTRTVTISSNKIRKGKRKSGSVSASPNKKVNVIAKDNIKIETFDKNYPGKIVTKAVILEKDIEVEVKEHDNEDKQETPEETGFGDKEESTELCTSNVIISDQVHQDVSQNVNENITTVSIEFETSSVESESPKKIPDNALPIQDSGINLRRRSSRRCRWHDNDSICERCDVTFIRKIAFERKPKKGRDSPRSLEDGSTIPVLTRDEGIPILYDDMYAQHIDDDDDGNMPQLLNMDGEEEVITETVHETVLGNIPTFVQDAFNTEDREVKSQDNSKVSVESS